MGYDQFHSLVLHMQIGQRIQKLMHLPLQLITKLDTGYLSSPSPFKILKLHKKKINLNLEIMGTGKKKWKILLLMLLYALNERLLIATQS